MMIIDDEDDIDGYHDADGEEANSEIDRSQWKFSFLNFKHMYLQEVIFMMTMTKKLNMMMMPIWISFLS